MRLYYISHDNLDRKTLKPLIPATVFVKLGVENNNLKRVSFASTVDHALLPIIYNRFRTSSKILNVFEPDDYSKLKVTHSKDLNMRGLVPGADKTKEHWVLNPVKIKYVGQIKLLRQKEKFVEIKINETHTIRYHFWEYKILDGEL